MGFIEKTKAWLTELTELIYVPRCASCFAVLPTKETALCKSCSDAYLTESKRLCARCGMVHKMCTCRVEYDGIRIPITHITGYDIRRSSVSKNIILRLKDNNYGGAFDFLANEMLTALKERYVRLFERGGVVITYVPRSKRAKRKAGHDQSEQLAKRISKASGAPLVPLFENVSRSYQKALNRAERSENARKGYRLISPELKLDDRIVVIIDDIVTTGASIGACASLARRNGAKLVIGLVCAKAISRKGIGEEDLPDRMYS